MHQLKSTILWLMCCTFCFSLGDLSTNQFLSVSTQQPSTFSKNQDLIGLQTSSFLSKNQLINLKKIVSRVLQDMQIIESNLHKPELDRNQLINLQHNANKRIYNLEKRLTKFIRQLEVNNTNRLNTKMVKVDQPSEKNAIKTIKDRNFFFSSSSPFLSSLSPSVFLSVGAISASITDNSSTINSGSSYSSVNYSSNSNSFPYVFSSLKAVSNRSRSEKDDINRKIVKKFSKELNSLSINQNKFSSYIKGLDTSENVNKIDYDNKVINHIFAKTKNKYNYSNKFSNQNFSSSTLSDQKNNSSNNRQKKQPFLLYHKCSEGYLQMNVDDNLNTGMDPDLLSKSEFIINYLPKSHRHQLQIHTKLGKYLCFNGQGKPKLMNGVHDLLCTFDIVYHQNEFFQLNSVVNTNWTLGFSQRGLPIRATSHIRKRHKKILNKCTLFMRHRSDKQLLQRLVDFRRYEFELKQKILVHNAQIEKIVKTNNLQDSLIMSKIERLGLLNR